MIQLHPALAGLVLLPLIGHLGCGTSCPQIAASRAAFDDRAREDRSRPDARLAIPFALMDRALAGRLARRPPVPIQLPTSALGLETSLALAIDGVTTRAAGPGRLGLTVTLVLFDERPTNNIVELEVDTEITPILVPPTAPTEPPALRITLTPADLGEVRPRPTGAGVQRLGRWLREELPPVARALVTDAVVEAAAREGLELVATEVWPRAKDRLLGDEALLDTSLTLPDLPIRDLALRSGRRALIADITSDLPDARGLAPGFDRAGERIVLRLSGGTAMGLINRAMDKRQVPSRFDGKGKPDRAGVWEARVGWRGGGNPLMVHLWRTRGKCQRATVGARVGFALRGDTVRVNVYDGRLITVAGPAFAEAFGWLERIFGDAMSFTFDAAALIHFDAGPDQARLRLARIRLDGDDLVLDLDLGLASK